MRLRPQKVSIESKLSKLFQLLINASLVTFSCAYVILYSTPVIIVHLENACNHCMQCNALDMQKQASYLRIMRSEGAT